MPCALSPELSDLCPELCALSPEQKGQQNSKYVVYIADPAAGLLKYTEREFCKCWFSTKTDGVDEGTALLLEPTPEFYKPEDEEKSKLFQEGHGKGTGFGLHLIKRICEGYGWTIQETGKHGEGVQFTMTIPKNDKDGTKLYEIN